MSPHHSFLMSAYGFGLFPLPAYRSASLGEWRIRTHMPSIADGYLATSAIEARAVLTRGREVWMSTGLLEQESHAWHVHCARGIVVAAGVGLGMYTYAAAMKPEVDLVIAADISSDIVALMKESTNFDNWPCRDKVRIVEADALGGDFAARVAECSGGRPVDYLYADIWPNFPATEAPGQTAAMARAIRPAAAGWWGQELSFAQHCRDSGCAADADSLSAYFPAAGVSAPTLTPGYLAFCLDVMKAYGFGERAPSPFLGRLRSLFGKR